MAGGISKTGINLFAYKTASTANIISQHGASLSANTWYDVPNMDGRADLADGLYIVTIYASLYSGGASIYQSKASSEVITWSTYYQNDSGRSSVAMQGNWMGHATNIDEDPNTFIEFGVKKEYGLNGGSGGLEFYPKYNLSLESGNGGKQLDIYLYKIT
jgi:hypothetical protein